MKANKFKKAFTLFSTIVLIFIFSLVAIKIFQTKSLNSVNIVDQYKYIQAKNHLVFLEEYINSLENFNNLKKLQIKNNDFKIIAQIKKLGNRNHEIELSVKAIDYDVRVYKKVEIIK